jgi:hypothetical protein
VDVAANAVTSGALANQAGAQYWNVTCIATDDSNTAAAINATLTINQGAKTFQFTAPSTLGSKLIFQSQVGVLGLGLDANGQVQAALTTTFAVNVKTSDGQRVWATGETTEQSSTYGNIVEFNQKLRGGGGALSGLAAARPVATGSARLYLCDDVPLLYFDDPGTVAWKQYAIGGRTYGPGLAGGWTVVGSLGLTQFADAILVSSQDKTINNGVALKPIPAFAGGLWVAELAWDHNGSSNAPSDPLSGVVVTNGATSGTSTGYCLDKFMQSGPIGGWEAKHVTIGTTTQTVVRQIAQSNLAVDGVSPLRARLYNDGTTLFYQFSANGVFWRNFWQETVPGGITNFGFLCGNFTGNEFCDMLVYGARAYAPTSVAVSSANVAGGILTVVTQTPHGLSTGFAFTLRGTTLTVGNLNGVYDGNSNAFGNPPLPIVTNSTTFTVNTGGANSSYVSGGTVYLISQ